MKNWFLALTAALGFCGCNSPHTTADIPAVKTFNVTHYQGKWYEIARLPNRFERGMSHVTATYTLLPDGRIRVMNKSEAIFRNSFHSEILSF